MPDSSLDLLTKFIPGFASYRSEQKRRDDDLAVREYLANRLQECKRDLQSFMTPLVEQANFNAITQGEKLRNAIELVQAKVRATVEGYSSWFETTRIDEAKLKQIVDLDNDLVGVIDRLQHEISSLSAASAKFEAAAEVVTQLRDRFLRRNELLAR